MFQSASTCVGNVRVCVCAHVCMCVSACACVYVCSKGPKSAKGAQSIRNIATFEIEDFFQEN